MRAEDFETTRGGYGLRYFFNAGYDRETNQCDAEGTDFYDEDDPDHYIGSVYGKTPSEIEEMSESEFVELLKENYIM